MNWQDIPQFTGEGNYAVDYPLPYLVQWVEKEIAESRLNMHPDFQRVHVWTSEQQSRFIEFILRGGKTGRDLYFNCPDWLRGMPIREYNEFVCVDGLQRITAIRRFVNDELEIFGHKFSDFKGRFPIAQTMRVHINDLKSRAEVLQWYLDLNSGGTQHTDEQLELVRRLLAEEKEKSNETF